MMSPFIFEVTITSNCLEEDGYLTRERDGRRNTYRVRPHLPLRHPIERKSKVAALLALAQDD